MFEHECLCISDVPNTLENPFSTVFMSNWCYPYTFKSALRYANQTSLYVDYFCIFLRLCSEICHRGSIARVRAGCVFQWILHEWFLGGWGSRYGVIIEGGRPPAPSTSLPSFAGYTPFWGNGGPLSSVFVSIQYQISVADDMYKWLCEVLIRLAS